jgi:geranylgeranyl diphosphate synthase type II
MLKETLIQGQKTADAALERLLPAATQFPASIHQAMRHSVFAGGKRLRPILCMESARMVCGSMPEGVDELGAAIEMLHTYSLVHDDLPALDNDDLRRGRPTCHKAFGEATAVLAGDALQTQAYEIMARLRCNAEARVHIIEELAHGTGTIEGMIGGQVVDLESEHIRPDLPILEYIHRAKTGALIVSALLSGCYYAGAKSVEIQRVREFGRAAGLAFQIADDILDVTQTSEQLGKTAGKDLVAEKVTYPALFGLAKAEEMAAQMIRNACSSLDSFGERANTLKEIARYLVERKK